FTSTTSMAGGKNVNCPTNNCRNYIKQLNVSLNPSGFSAGSHYYYSNSNAPRLTLTMSSSSSSAAALDTPLKKRLHSSSPSKHPSPYHTVSNSVSKDYNLIFSNSSNPLSPDWEKAFKRLKVMHNNNKADFGFVPESNAN